MLPPKLSRFPPPWTAGDIGAAFVGSVKERAVADHRTVVGHVAP